MNGPEIAQLVGQRDFGPPNYYAHTNNATMSPFLFTPSLHVASLNLWACQWMPVSSLVLIVDKSMGMSMDTSIFLGIYCVVLICT